MKNAATAPEIADPYATLEKILKVIGRSWLSEEWRLEDIRLLAQEAIATRGKRAKGKSTRVAAPSLQLPIHFKPDLPRTPVKRGDSLPS
jgi:hypothetical protein